MKLILIAMLMFLPLQANADYFFGVNKNGQATPCQSTDWSDEMVKSRFGETLTCTSAADKDGTMILTCRDALGRLNSMVYKAKALGTCESLHASITNILNK